MFIAHGPNIIEQAPEERNIIGWVIISLLLSQGRWIGCYYKHPAPTELNVVATVVWRSFLAMATLWSQQHTCGAAELPAQIRWTLMIDHLCSLLIFIACCSSAGQTLAAASGSISHWFEPPFRGGLLPAGLGESTVAGGSPPLNVWSETFVSTNWTPMKFSSGPKSSGGGRIAFAARMFQKVE